MNRIAACEAESVGESALRLGRTTNRGQRPDNQDRECFFKCELGEGFLVADGMGGREGGATAAEIVIERLPQLLREFSEGIDVSEAIHSVTRRLNREVQEAQGSVASHREMGSTMVLALWKDRQLWIAHVGDSRAYLFRKGGLSRLTTDHTVAQQTIGASGATDEEVRRHPSASILTRVVGQLEELIPDIKGPLPLFEGDGVLLCSDGLSGFATDDQIQMALRRGGDPASRTLALANLALEAGSTDNVTVQFIQVVEKEQPHPAPEAITADSRARMRLWIAFSIAVGCIVTWAAFHFAYVIFVPSEKTRPTIEMKLDP